MVIDTLFRPNDTLPAIEELMAIADNDELYSLESAIADWEDHPPDKEFQNILTAQ